MSDLALSRAVIGPFATHILTAAIKFNRLLNRSSRRALRSTEGGYRANLAHEIQIWGCRFSDGAQNPTIWLSKNKSNAGHELTSEISKSRTSDTYTDTRKPNIGSVIFHWLGAILVFIALLAGIYAVYYAGCCSFARTSTFLLHAYAGLSVLGLVVARLVFRALFAWPHAKKKFIPGAIVASVIHWLLYLMMVMIPLTGWIVASAMGCCVYVPGLPNVNELSLGMSDITLADVGAAYQVHVFMAWIIIALISLHVAAALFYHFILKNDTLKRMLPGRLRNCKTGITGKNDRSLVSNNGRNL